MRRLTSILLLTALATGASFAQEPIRIQVETIPMSTSKSGLKSASIQRAEKPPVTIITAYPYQGGVAYQCDHADPNSALVRNWMRLPHQPQ